jgi:hypothetical protein
VITNEPSQQVTPLSTEQAGFPAEIAADGLTQPPGPSTQTLLAWLEVLISFVIWILSVVMLAVVPVIVALPYLIYTDHRDRKHSCKTRHSSFFQYSAFFRRIC